MNSHILKIAVRVALLIGLICFFCPFVLASCSTKSVEVSGVELMTNISFQEDVEFQEDDRPNAYLLIAFIMGIVGLACAFDSSEDKVTRVMSAWCSVTGAVLLLIFRLTFWSWYSDYKNIVDVEFKWGWVMAIIAYACASCAAFYRNYLIANERSINQVQLQESSQEDNISLETNAPPNDNKSDA